DNQPRLNAMTRQMLAELGRLWDELERDDCRCIVLTGAGERAFTVGADISGDLSAAPEMARMVSHALLKTDAYRKPIIAAVNGDCIGGGIELMLSTDIRASVPTARFGLTEVKWSIYPFGGATIKLVQQIGYVHAMDLLLTARLIDAEEAARLGLVNRLVARDQLMGWAIETAERIAANSPSAVQAVKRKGTATIADHWLAPEAQEQEFGDKVPAGPHFAEGLLLSVRSASRTMSDPVPRPRSETLGDLLDEIAAATPRRLAVVFRDERLDYADLKARSDGFALALLAAGVRRGDRVALLVTNRTEWLVAARGAAKIGAVTAAISTFSTPRELGWMLEHCGARVLVTLRRQRPPGQWEWEQVRPLPMRKARRSGRG